MIFQDSAIRRMSIAASRAFAQDGLSPEMEKAIEECSIFFANALEQRSKTPYNPSNKSPWGQYVMVRTTHDTFSDEWTNIGVIIFDGEGKQIWTKMGPYDRALARGDLKIHTTQWLNSYPKSKEHIEQVHRSLESMGHQMSCVQITPPRGLALDLENYYSIYMRMVLAINERYDD